MKKNVKRFLFVLLPVFIFGCANVYKGDDSLIGVKEVIPPGDTYTPEGKYNLNVVYYVPADEPEREDWHYRLSGITLHVQKFFTQALQRYKINKKFGLVLNDENPEFVKIHYIKSKRKIVEMGESSQGLMAQEVLDYFVQNPGEKTSDQFLVFMPKYKGAFFGWSYLENNQSMAFCGCDENSLKISFFESLRARAKYLEPMGRILYNVGHLFYLKDDSHGRSDAHLSLMGFGASTISIGTIAGDSHTYFYPQYCGKWGSGSSLQPGTPDKFRLSEANVRFLNYFQIFQEKESPIVPLEVTVEDVKIACKENALFVEDTVFVTCQFSSREEVGGVILYNDPWRSAWDNKLNPALDEDEVRDTGGDAYSLYKDHLTFEQVGSSYRVSFALPLAEMLPVALPAGKVPHKMELRFRFIGKGGDTYPSLTVAKGSLDKDAKLRFPYTIKYASELNTHDIATLYGVKEE